MKIILELEFEDGADVDPLSVGDAVYNMLADECEGFLGVAVGEED